LIEQTTNTIGCDLAAEVAGRFGRARIRAFGASMVPAILPGDVVTVERATIGEVAPGEIVLFARQGRLVAHRVVRKVRNQGEYLITRGDRMHQEDSRISEAELIGRVTELQRGNSSIAMCPEISLAQRMLGGVLRWSNRATSLYILIHGLQVQPGPVSTRAAAQPVPGPHRLQVEPESELSEP